MVPLLRLNLGHRRQDSDYTLPYDVPMRSLRRKDATQCRARSDGKVPQCRIHQIRRPSAKHRLQIDLLPSRGDNLLHHTLEDLSPIYAHVSDVSSDQSTFDI